MKEKSAIWREVEGLDDKDLPSDRALMILMMKIIFVQ